MIDKQSQFWADFASKCCNYFNDHFVLNNFASFYLFLFNFDGFVLHLPQSYFCFFQKQSIQNVLLPHWTISFPCSLFSMLIFRYFGLIIIISDAAELTASDEAPCIVLAPNDFLHLILHAFDCYCLPIASPPAWNNVSCYYESLFKLYKQ